jgi:hypothetical protein
MYEKLFTYINLKINHFIIIPQYDKHICVFIEVLMNKMIIY